MSETRPIWAHSRSLQTNVRAPPQMELLIAGNSIARLKVIRYLGMDRASFDLQT